MVKEQDMVDICILLARTFQDQISSYSNKDQNWDGGFQLILNLLDWLKYHQIFYPALN